MRIGIRLLALFAVLALGASSVLADPPTLVIVPGVDLLRATSAEVSVSVPPEFFGPGSQAYSGTIGLTGVNMETRGPWEVGRTHVVLHRWTEVSMPDAPAAQNILVEFAGVSLASSAPISVQFTSGSQSWDASLRLKKDQPKGMVHLSRTSATGGTCTMEIMVHAVVEFEREGVTREYDLGNITLTASSGTWSTIPGSATAALTVPGLPLGLALSASLSSLELSISVVPADADPNNPGPAFVSTSATIDSTAHLGRGCTVNGNASIGAGAVIGPGAVIETGTTIGSNAVVGASVSVGAGTTISSGAIIDSGSTLLNGVFVGISAVIGQDSTLSANCIVGAGSIVGARAQLFSAASVGSGCSLGSDVSMGMGSSISDDLTIARGAVIAASMTQSVSLGLFCLANGGEEVLPIPTQGAGSGKSAGVGLVSSTTAGLPFPIQANVRFPDPSNPPPGYGGLPGDVGNDVARPNDRAPGCGGALGNPDYGDGGRKCGWFAETLRMKLAGLGYSTTFTVVWRRNPDDAWWKFWEPEWIDGHNLVDIHWPDGTVSWIEAQWSGASGAVDAPKTKKSLDGNGDGKVTYSNGATDDATDGDVRVEVFGSRAEATAAGRPAGGA